MSIAENYAMKLPGVRWALQQIIDNADGECSFSDLGERYSQEFDAKRVAFAHVVSVLQSLEVIEVSGGFDRALGEYLPLRLSLSAQGRQLVRLQGKDAGDFDQDYRPAEMIPEDYHA